MDEDGVVDWVNKGPRWMQKGKNGRFVYFGPGLRSWSSTLAVNFFFIDKVAFLPHTEIVLQNTHRSWQRINVSRISSLSIGDFK